jgi:hypothetical protein
MPYKDSEKQKEHNRQYNRAYYKRNRAKMIARQNGKNKAFVARRRKRVSEYKVAHGCARCPERHPAALGFHHRDPEQKEFDVSTAISQCLSWARIMKEIEKCIVLCHNCHAKEHWAEATPL